VSLQRDCKPIADKPVNAITTADVLQTIKAVHQRAPVTALRLRGRIEQVLAAAQALGHIDPDKRNPAIWRGHLDKLLPKRPPAVHLKALPYAELPQFMSKLRALRRGADGVYRVEVLALDFAILCAARSGEVRLARWSEIDPQQQLWSLPAARMKAHRPHWVPLSAAACAILDVMRELRCGDFIFSDDGRKPIGDKRFERLLRRMDYNCNAHGFRSSFADWAADTTSADPATCEAALAHTFGSETRLSYRRGHPLAKHRALLAKWDKYLAGKPANVRHR
jgi:integrase